jgi:predicted metal-dependent HD superfamily phosphohydrolase
LVIRSVGLAERAALVRAQTESGGAQPAYQVATLDDDCACCNHRITMFFGNVVMVALECSAGNPDVIGELEEFVVRDVTHHVAPLSTAEPPPCFVDQNRHGASMPSVCHTRYMAEDLAAGLSSAWQRAITTDMTLFERVLRRHREKHRHYHNVAHVTAVVAHVEQLIAAESELGPLADPSAVVAAAVYHDAIYEPESPSNERASGRLAQRDLTAIGWPIERSDRVVAMIEGTATHLDPPDLDTAILFDADLAILGSDPPAYDRYVAAVRAEYHHVSDEAWRNGRSTVLQGLLDRTAIFATATGQDRWEALARSNLSAELASLGDAVNSSGGEDARSESG